MSQQQLRTIRLDANENQVDGLPAEQEDVLIAAVGTLRRAAPGRSVRETLEAEGITLPTPRQTVRVNNEEVRDMTRTLRPGDKLTIVNRVAGGLMRHTEWGEEEM